MYFSDKLKKPKIAYSCDISKLSINYRKLNKQKCIDIVNDTASETKSLISNKSETIEIRER